MSQRVALLAVGHFDQAREKTLSLAAAEAACETSFAQTASEATAWLSDNEPLAVVADLARLIEQRLAVELRAEARRAVLPILGVSDDLGELVFASALASGADDLCSLARPRSLTSRLRALPHQASIGPGDPRGNVVVADSDGARRALVGRVLRNASYSVNFAVDTRDTLQFASAKDMGLVVLYPEIDTPPRTLIETSRANGSQADWIVCAAARELTAQHDALHDLEGVVVADADAPAENLLFLANELASRDLTNKRASPRLLYGTAVGFRGAGREEDEIGFCYNISGAGIYVRTLLPPADEFVWLELCPPRSERRVRLVARAVWRRRFGAVGRSTVPPGFGVEIVDGAVADRKAWVAGYDAYLRAMG